MLIPSLDCLGLWSAQHCWGCKELKLTTPSTKFYNAIANHGWLLTPQQISQTCYYTPFPHSASPHQPHSFLTLGKKFNPLFLEIMIGMNLINLPFGLPLGNYLLHHKMPCILNHYFLSPILLCFQCKYFLSSRAQLFQVPPIPYSFMYFSLSLSASVPRVLLPLLS